MDRYVIWAVLGKRYRAPRRRRPLHHGPARNWKYRGWVRTQACVGCGLDPAGHAAHTQNNGTASKGSDYSCVPLCPECHAEYDNGLRSKGFFEEDHGINMKTIVRDLNHEWFAHAAEVK